MCLGCLDIRIEYSFFDSICGFQGTYLTEFYQSLANSISSNPLITGKNQLYGTALPCWIRLTHPSHLPASQASLSAPPIQICPFYIKHSREWFLFIGIRQPPAFPCRLQHSIIGRLGLNHRVRDGNGCYPRAHRHQKILGYLDNPTIDNSSLLLLPF